MTTAVRSERRPETRLFTVAVTGQRGAPGDRVPAGLGQSRLDVFVQARCPDLSRSRSAALIRQGHVTVNGAAAKPATAVHTGDVVRVRVPPPAPSHLVAQPLPLTVLYQDAHVIVVDKPAGMTVHPAPGHPDRTLVNVLLALVSDLPGVGGEQRPGIVHRLDKDTSGVMVIAKTDAAHANLTRQWKDRQVRKTYLALLTGTVRAPEGEVSAPIARNPRNRQKQAVVEGGRRAATRWRVRERYAAATLIEAQPLTGRTHQLRVHFAYMGHPIVGDRTYGKASPLIARQALHAWRLGLYLPSVNPLGRSPNGAPPDEPVAERAWREFEAPLPDDFRAALNALGGTAPAMRAPRR